MTEQRKKRRKLVRTGLVLISLLLVTGCWYYVSDYSLASSEAIRMIKENARVIEEDNFFKVSALKKQQETTESDELIGMVFYPGGKVEAAAYVPLVKQIADQGVTCYLMKMPFNLAVFGKNAFDRIYEAYPMIEKWYLGGHSLGGAMASDYLGEEKNQVKVEGLILLAAYPVNQASNKTLVLYGEYDQVLNLAKLDEVDAKKMILGGNHAYFGNYGEQAGDGQASISREQQQAETVDRVMAFIHEEREGN